ncbi:MAG: MxaS protein [Proteobacteria bacterium]|nr:MxaS protein [Pseudomonadota bacterium]
MSEHREFHYRLPQRIGGWRPGSHRGSSLGAGQEFVSHMRLYDRPDPRRLDLRASLRNIQQEWLVRVNRQQASIAVHVVVDVSTSMSFGSRRSKLDVAAEFVEALGQSTFKVGDALGMLAFDSSERTDLFVPAMVSRGMGETMAALLRSTGGTGGDVTGLVDAIQHLAGRKGLVFLVSDFHWPLAGLNIALDSLSQSFVVPVVVWDTAEIRPPAHDGLAQLRDVESGAQRTLWMRARMRERWVQAAAVRRAELDQLFAMRAMRPFYVTDRFDSEAMSQYFFEVAA